MKDYTIEQIRNLLSENVLEVTFTKADGSERVMMASTNSMYIPYDEGSKSSGRKPNPNIVTAVDVEKGAWRSFRFDSVKGFVVTDRPVLKKFNEVNA